MAEHQYGKFDSWEINSENVARKICDKSFFQYKGSGIPQTISWFFNAEHIDIGDKIDLILEYDGFEFDARVQKSDNSSNQLWIFWDAALAEEFEPYADDDVQHILAFRRDGEHRYSLSFDEASGSKAWLLTWNKDNWFWKDYEKVCEDTKSGKHHVEGWACANKNPQIGDEVFLMKLGENPRGIIGHGKVIRPQYITNHYDPSKAEEGKKEKAIDVEFDRILNYEKDHIIKQEVIMSMCGTQHWSPQNSGIEIKPEALTVLQGLWKMKINQQRRYYALIEVLHFLGDYSGKHYLAPERAGNQAEYMSEMKKSGIGARQIFIDFIKDTIQQIPGLEYVSCSNWVNQSQVVESYFRIELKKQEWLNRLNSISVSIGDGYVGKEACIVIRLETREISSKAPDYKRQLRLLDCELLDGMGYLAQYYDGEYHYHGTDKEAVKALCDDGTIRKLEIIEEINDYPHKELAGTVFFETKKAIEEIYPLYEYVMSDIEKTDEDGWWPSLEDYDPGINTQEYHDLFVNETVVKRSWLDALYDLYKMPGHLGTCADLEHKYNKPFARYNRYLTSLARRVAEKTNCKLTEDQDSSKYWPVLFQGKSVAKDDTHKGNYCWKIRMPVVEAIEKLIDEGFFEEKGRKDMVDFDRNMILYGPPGTGKTYNTVIYAVAICEGKAIEEVQKESYSDVLIRYRELQDAGRIEFTTFHQSYGYEEFIEGIKPKLNSESDTLGYIIEDGVFKAFCKRAKAVKVHSNDTFGIKSNPHIWGMLLGGTGSTEIKQYCFENDVIRFGWDNIADTDVIEDNPDASKSEKFAIHQIANFIYSIEVGDIVLVAKNITTIDAIGVITGDYEYDQTKENHCRTRKVKWLVNNVEIDILPYLPNGRKKLPTSYLYPFDYLGIDKVTEILDELHEQSDIYFETETKPYVFIIDEINRGNISKIFGELITLIEETKRAGSREAMEATLPYSGEAFSVPNNVYILGTMNTADRSIALMDTALRRRFEFVEMMPNSEVLESLGIGTILVDNELLNVAKMLDVINERIEYLFDREHTIGHAFFRKLEDDISIDILAGIFEKKIIPLLQEYFYEDYEKIQLVLGDNEKEDEFKFILDKKVELRQVFKGNPDIDLPPKGYSIQKSAFKKIQSYKLIGRDL